MCAIGCRRKILAVVLSLLLITFAVRRADAVGTAFTYQGQLQLFGAPTNGTCSMQFSLWDALAGPTQIGSTLSTSVTVVNGVFSVPLDFGGSAFTGGDRWLEIGVDCPGGGGFMTLQPRQPVTAAPYALLSNSVLNDAITGAKILDGTIDTADLAASAVRTAKIADNAVTSAKILDGSIVAADVDTNSLQRRVTGTCPGTGAMSAINADGSVVCVSGSVTFAGSGTALTAAHSDHNHFNQSWGGSAPFGLEVTNSSTFGVGVKGTTAGVDGVLGESTGFNGNGVHGIANSGTSAFGVYGQSDAGSGVRGTSTAGSGVAGRSSSGIGTSGLSDTGTGIKGTTGGADGVRGESTAADGNGVHGIANNGSTASGVWGESTSGYAGYFSGKVAVTGMLTKPAGSFRIDHPLDPGNKYLSHSFVESPDMKNIYDGVVVLDENGEAVVSLPAWFQALNRDFRYQLTGIGAFAPVYVAEEVDHGQFKIAGGFAAMKVSWQVTGIRQDAFANAHRIQVEEEKPPNERGHYQNPAECGMPESMGIDYDRAKRAQP